MASEEASGAVRADDVLVVRDLRTTISVRAGEVRAVDGVSFNVRPGETLGLVGESGSGKTMTGLSLMRLLPPGGRISGGTIELAGRGDIATLSTTEMRRIRGNDIGMVFQDPMTSLDPTMPIGAQIAETVRLHRRATKSDAYDRAEKMLDLVGLPRPAERLKDYPHQLSGGLRQRVMIAIALACEPRLLIADEPTTALDVTIQAQILDLLDDLKQRLGMAIVLITHDLGVIAGRADRTMVMYAGKIVEHSPTERLFHRMRHPYSEALLASIPKVDQAADQVLYSIPGLPPELIDPPRGCRFAARCHYGQDRCRSEEPALSGEPEHEYACFFPTSTDAARLGVTSALTGVSRASPAPPDAGASSSEGAAGSARPHGTAPLVRLEDVSKEFVVSGGVVFDRPIGTLKAVTGVSIDIGRGETVGLVGESGCGKTTVGRMVVALETPSGGRVLVDGVDLASLRRTELRRQRRDLQLMFQDPYSSLDPRMHVGTIIREPLVIQGEGGRAEQDRRLYELLDAVGLSRNVIDRYPHEFSGGQRQRIGLARALALRPRLIVADEPVSALDVSIRSQILNLMRQLQAEHDLAYLLISHDLSVVRYMASRIGVMYLGRLVELGGRDDIYERPAHPYTAGLLAAIPVPNPSIERSKRGRRIRGELPSPIDPPSGCRFRTRCERARDVCAATAPPLVRFGPGHLAACHFPLREPEPQPVAAPVSRPASSASQELPSP